METIKTSSNKWINDYQFTTQKFDWQKGYGVFTHSKLQVDTVCKYIENQEEHPEKRTFREEFIEILQRNDMEYEEKYLFEFFEEVEDDEY